MHTEFWWGNILDDILLGHQNRHGRELNCDDRRMAELLTDHAQTQAFGVAALNLRSITLQCWSVVTQCSLVQVYRRFRGTSGSSEICSARWDSSSTLKTRQSGNITRLHGIISQKTLLFLVKSTNQFNFRVASCLTSKHSPQYFVVLKTLSVYLFLSGWETNFNTQLKQEVKLWNRGVRLNLYVFK
jgi:hypothetical protein